MKKALFVNGSYNEIPLIKAAHDLGYFVITSGNDSSGEGHKISDKYIPCDYSKKEEIYKIAKDEKVDAICSCGNDFGALSASFAAEKLGLKGHDSYEVSRIFHEKDQFKNLCNKLKLNTPRSFVFGDKKKAIAHIQNVKFPQIVKPNDLGGGKGMTVVNSFDEATKAIDKAFSASKSKIVLIEDYISGNQYGFSCFLINGKVIFNYLSRDLSYLNPYMVWTAIAFYEDEQRELRTKIVKDVEKIARFTKMCDGMLTIQLIVKDGEPYYLETMRRCLGNMHYYCLSNDFGFDVFKLFVANEFGIKVSKFLPNLVHQVSASAFMGVYSKENGKYLGYTINEKNKDKVFYRYDIMKIGENIDNFLTDKIANIFLRFNTKKERDAFIENRFDVVEVKMEKINE